MNNLPESALLQPNPDVVLGDVEGEVVALNADAGSYLHLNSSGSFIISMLDDAQPKTVAWLYQQVQQEYAVDAITCRREVGTFLARLVELDLIRVVPNPP